MKVAKPRTGVRLGPELKGAGLEWGAEAAGATSCAREAPEATGSGQLWTRGFSWSSQSALDNSPCSFRPPVVSHWTFWLLVQPAVLSPSSLAQEAHDSGNNVFILEMPN